MFSQKQLDYFKTKKVFIHTHDFPDPDAIACAAGVQELLSHYDIESTICYYGEIERSNQKNMLSNFEITVFSRKEFKNELNDAINILVDSQLNNSNMSLDACNDIYCIDHHPIFVENTYNWMDIRPVGACASIIASYFREANITPSKNTASALCYAIKMDTNDFNRGATKEDLEMFNYLFDYCDFDAVTEMCRNHLVLSDFDAFLAALKSIHIKGRLGFAYIPFQCPNSLVAIISDFILSTEEVRLSVVYSKFDDKIKLSIRSEDNDKDAGQIINQALKDIGNGGGHPTMAGGVIFGECIPELQPNLRENIEKLFIDVIQG